MGSLRPGVCQAGGRSGALRAHLPSSVDCSSLTGGQTLFLFPFQAPENWPLAGAGGVTRQQNQHLRETSSLPAVPGPSGRLSVLPVSWGGGSFSVVWTSGISITWNVLEQGRCSFLPPPQLLIEALGENL